MKPKIDITLGHLVAQSVMQPKEELQKIHTGDHRLFIGIPKESQDDENRVCLTPDAVALLVNNGHEILIESEAGVNAKFTDRAYSEAGAKISYSKEEVFKSDIVLKVEPPTIAEIELIKNNGTLISALQMSRIDQQFFHELNAKKITAVGFEYLEDKGGTIPVIRAMSEIAGSAVMPIAAEYLTSKNGKGIILGGITGVKPTKVIVLGAGTVAEYAIRTALGLGAEVKVFDNHVYKLRRLKHNLGIQIHTSTIDTVVLRKELKEADVVIGAIRTNSVSPCIITDDMIAEMQPDSVIIDVSIDQGGCIETSRITNHKNPTFRKHDVIHYCVPNIASLVARTASTALSNIFTPVLLQISKKGGVDDLIFSRDWFMKGVYAYKGFVTKPYLAKKFDLKHREMKLLTAFKF